MENWKGTLILVSALSLVTGPAAAKQVEKLHCSDKCTFTEEQGPDQTKEYRGFCDGTEEMSVANSKLKCSPSKNMTCTVSFLIDTVTEYWSCSCTNWSPSQRRNATVTLTCPPPKK